MITNWEPLRAEWVNGNKSYCIKLLDKISKRTLLDTICTALLNYHECNQSSGDFRDLIEILTYYRRHKILNNE